MLSAPVILGCIFVFVLAGLATKQAIKWYTKIDEKLAAQQKPEDLMELLSAPRERRPKSETETVQ